jgi:DNA protecting protein DprA
MYDSSSLLNVKGIGKKRLETISAYLSDRQSSLSDLALLDVETLKSTFRFPVRVAQALAEHLKTLPVEKDKNAEPFATFSITDSAYPAKIKRLLGKKSPTTLFYWGNTELLNYPSVGFCGSRNVSLKGLEVTEDVVKQIIPRQWVVISGHAKGVDITAHITALQHGGSTIIVIPEGIAQFKLNKALKAFITPNNTLIISQFAADAQWAVGRAMQRNQTIIALSNVMVLIESRLEGGTFAAGKSALKLKVPLFVAQYKMPSEANQGNDYFLKHGAKKFGKHPETGKANISALIDCVALDESLTENTLPTQISLLP